jgi:hypothetical protein
VARAGSRGTSQNITWSTSADAASIDLDLSTDGGSSWSSIATGLGNTGSYAWTVPNTPTSTARVRVTARDALLNPISDVSNANFTIRPPTGITVTPVSGLVTTEAGGPRASRWCSTVSRPMM